MGEMLKHRRLARMHCTSFVVWGPCWPNTPLSQHSSIMAPPHTPKTMMPLQDQEAHSLWHLGRCSALYGGGHWDRHRHAGACGLGLYGGGGQGPRLWQCICHRIRAVHSHL